MPHCHLPGKIIIVGSNDFCEITEKLLINFRGGHPKGIQGRRWSGPLPLPRQVRQLYECLIPSSPGRYRCEVARRKRLGTRLILIPTRADRTGHGTALAFMKRRQGLTVARTTGVATEEKKSSGLEWFGTMWEDSRQSRRIDKREESTGNHRGDGDWIEDWWRRETGSEMQFTSSAASGDQAPANHLVCCLMTRIGNTDFWEYRCPPVKKWQE